MDGLIAHLTDTHMSKYKNKSSLESAQAKRRREILEKQQKRRQEQINRSRNLLNYNSSDEESSSSDSEPESAPSVADSDETDMNFEMVPAGTDCGIFADHREKQQQKNKKNLKSNKKNEKNLDSNFAPPSADPTITRQEADYKPDGVIAYKKNQNKPIFNKFKNRLMTNEWLLNRPDDLEDWVWVPCPHGNRSLVIATAGETRCYSNKGFHRTTVQTILPNGNQLKNQQKHHTILDCILSFREKTIYVLDVLKWKSYEYFHCTAEMRHERKLDLLADQELDFKDSQHLMSRFWKVKCLKAFNCNELELENINKKEDTELDLDDMDDSCVEKTALRDPHGIFSKINSPPPPKFKLPENFVDTPGSEFYFKNSWKLDGILVYHKEGMYYPSGPDEETYPLFGWLKQERMLELLNSYAEFNFDPSANSWSGNRSGGYKKKTSDGSSREEKRSSETDSNWRQRDAKPQTINWGGGKFADTEMVRRERDAGVVCDIQKVGSGGIYLKKS